MGLFTCGKCGQPVSPIGYVCPHCGARWQEQVWNSVLRRFEPRPRDRQEQAGGYLFSGILLIAVGAICCWGLGRLTGWYDIWLTEVLVYGAILFAVVSIASFSDDEDAGKGGCFGIIVGFWLFCGACYWGLLVFDDARRLVGVKRELAEVDAQLKILDANARGSQGKVEDPAWVNTHQALMDRRREIMCNIELLEFRARIAEMEPYSQAETVSKQLFEENRLPWSNVHQAVNFGSEEVGIVIKTYQVTSFEIKNPKVARIDSLAALAKLEHLDLTGTRVSDLRPLAACKSLRTVIARDTQVTFESVAALKRELPECAIDWDGDKAHK